MMNATVDYKFTLPRLIFNKNDNSAMLFLEWAAINKPKIISVKNNQIHENFSVVMDEYPNVLESAAEYINVNL